MSTKPAGTESTECEARGAAEQHYEEMTQELREHWKKQGAAEQEWTWKTVEKLIDDAESISQYAGDAIAKAHNAAIAAACAETQTIVVNTFKQQLAAERETARRAGVVALQFKEQLAAAVEALEWLRERVQTGNHKAVIDAALAAVKEGK